MNLEMLLMMAGFSLSAVLIYTIIGFVPGTDETSVLLPITLALVLLGVKGEYVLSFFIAAIITLNLTNAMPTALVGLPGGVMSSPMIEDALMIKQQGHSAKLIQKMAASSLIACLISIPTSFVIAKLIAPFAQYIQPYSAWIFLIGAVLLSLNSKNKILSLFAIIPLSLLFMGLRHLYWGSGVVPNSSNITVSFFLGITIGPLVVSLFKLLNKEKQKDMLVSNYNQIQIPTKEQVQTQNPFSILTKQELTFSAISAFVVNFFFFLSPVGLLILIGDMIRKRIKNSEEKPFVTITSMSAMAQSTYLSGMIISLYALGIPLSPVALGPGNALFSAPPMYTLENNLHYTIPSMTFILAVAVASLIAMSLSYFLILNFSTKVTNFVLRKIPHEAVLGLFIAFVFLLAYMDAGMINIFGVLLIGLVCGTLNYLGVNLGVQFMILYASPMILKLVTSL